MLVKDFMTKSPETVSPDDDPRVVFNMLSDKRIRQAPVVLENKVVGIVTDRDLRMVIVQHDKEHNLTVSSVMTPDPLTINEDVSLEEAGALLTGRKFNAVPVLSSEGELSGILTTTDILKGLLYIIEIQRQNGPLINK